MKVPTGEPNISGESRAAEKREWLTLPQAAAELQVSEALLRRAYYRGELVAYKFTNRIRVRRADLLAWLESQRWSPARCREHSARPGARGRKSTRARSSTSPLDSHTAPGVQ